jgi:uncharacterized protein YjbI with pentapeptide repeats
MSKGQVTGGQVKGGNITGATVTGAYLTAANVKAASITGANLTAGTNQTQLNYQPPTNQTGNPLSKVPLIVNLFGGK